MTFSEYLSKAAEMAEMARRAPTDAARAEYQKLEQSWRELANFAERGAKPAKADDEA